jgi:hypothetical protein
MVFLLGHFLFMVGWDNNVCYDLHSIRCYLTREEEHGWFTGAKVV